MMISVSCHHHPFSPKFSLFMDSFLSRIRIHMRSWKIGQKNELKLDNGEEGEKETRRDGKKKRKNKNDDYTGLDPPRFYSFFRNSEARSEEAAAACEAAAEPMPFTPTPPMPTPPIPFMPPMPIPMPPMPPFIAPFI